MSLSFGFVVGLFALLLVPLVPLFAWRSRYGLSRRRTAMVTATRVLVVTLVVLALADLRLGLPDDALTVAPIVDGSASISGSERATVDAQLATLRTPNSANTDRDVSFVDVPAGPRNAEHTDLAADVELATALMAPGRLRRVLLATDGRDHGGGLGHAIAAARRAGVRVDVLPLGDAPTADAFLLSRLEIPRLVRGGETLDVGAELRTTVETSASLEVWLDERVIATEHMTAPAGTSLHRLSVTFPDDEGVHQLEVRATSAASSIPQNDRIRALVQVTPRPRVLLVHEYAPGVEPALASVLRSARYVVEPVRMPEATLTADALERYALVVLDELDLAHVNDAQQRALRDWVERRGGGLVTITGGHAVRREPDVLRALEPVGPPAAIPEPRPLELVLVLDRSSSMDGRPMSTARRAAALAVTSLREDAMAGFVAFSDGADHIRQPVDSTHFMELATYISSVNASGGTDIGAALRAANGVVTGDPRYIHHVILLSDGESDPAPALAAASAIAARGVTISVISLGYRNQLMEQIAAIGRGRYHVTQNIGSLPSLMVRESQFRQQPGSRQVSFATSVVTPSPLLDGTLFDGTDGASAPALTGYALSDARREADTLLSAPDGMPLLAHWQRGLGQVATFTSATNGGWADGWRAWPGYHALWSGIARSMLRPRTADPVGVRLDRDARRPDSRTLTVTGPTIGSEPAPLVRLSRARIGEAETPALRLIGPGVWQAEVSVGDGFVVSARMPWDPEPTAAAAVDHSYAEELTAFGADREALAALAALGGGRVLTTPAEVLVKTGAEEAFARSMRFPLLCAALALYLLGLLLLRLPEKRAALAVASPRRSVAPAPTPRAEKEAA